MRVLSYGTSPELLHEYQLNLRGRFESGGVGWLYTDQTHTTAGHRNESLDSTKCRQLLHYVTKYLLL